MSEDKLTARVDNYIVTISPELGHGSHGQVLEAEHIKTKEKCVVKKIELTKDPARHKRSLEIAETEQEILSRLSHKHIVKYLEVFPHRNSWWLFMERCNSGNLKDYLESRKFIQLDVKVKMMLQCASAVQYLHSKRIIHRDIKLENFLVHETQGDFVIKLSDFGLSKLIEDDSFERSCVKTKVGTRFYRAPELFSGQYYTASVDTFALGLAFLVLFLFGPDNECTVPLSGKG